MGISCSLFEHVSEEKLSKVGRLHGYHDTDSSDKTSQEGPTENDIHESQAEEPEQKRNDSNLI
jgi:hypothetical protein